ncbi:hypothetical protein BGW36DRAFT_365521 [Talaromyces proteolyticus]|uniref:D-xylose 1-dehydrogenase (NADP(+), D-xylono-1,5-lactone-forming) n=1 Tax=Talaromyces proteolyticus TaxID=1131652 RepID=A0AAD4KDC0_9EURO|nr:uncharacterized protein BGW36DRAFT_365521 [Talaromyces proteolyticus]KAH8688987.1 hypothetical protein BGW36DRAFT_365521 [Talaromyces proteolyticus]
MKLTPHISSTLQCGLIKLGIVGCGRITKRFIEEAKFVSGVIIESVYSQSNESASVFAKEADIPKVCHDFDQLLETPHCIYIASPHNPHASYAKKAVASGKHVLSPNRRQRSYSILASQKGVDFLEAIKRAYMPGFQRMIVVAQNGTIGSRSVTAICTMIRPLTRRECDISQDGGCITEHASYPLLVIAEIFGVNEVECITSKSIRHDTSDVDIFSRIDIHLKNPLATCAVGIGVKAEGDLVIAGTKGYIYVPAPWWLTTSFKGRFEDPVEQQKFSIPMKGDGLRYEITEFIRLINEDSR